MDNNKIHKITGVNGVLSVYQHSVEINQEELVIIHISEITKAEFSSDSMVLYCNDNIVHFEIPIEKVDLAKKIVKTINALINGELILGHEEQKKLLFNKRFNIIAISVIVFVAAIGAVWLSIPSKQEYPEPVLMMFDYLDNWIEQDWSGMEEMPFGNFTADGYQDLLQNYNLSAWAMEYNNRSGWYSFDLDLTINGELYKTSARMSSHITGEWTLIEFAWDDFILDL